VFGCVGDVHVGFFRVFKVPGGVVLERVGGRLVAVEAADVGEMHVLRLVDGRRGSVVLGERENRARMVVNKRGWLVEHREHMEHLVG